MQFKSIYPIRALSGAYHSKPEWIWEQWQWRGALHSPKIHITGYLHHQIVKCHIRTLVWGESYSSEEVQSVDSTAPADWASLTWMVCMMGSKWLSWSMSLMSLPLLHQQCPTWMVRVMRGKWPNRRMLLMGLPLLHQQCPTCLACLIRGIWVMGGKWLSRKMLLMTLLLLPQQCPACLACLTWIVCVMGGKWPSRRMLLMSLP